MPKLMLADIDALHKALAALVPGENMPKGLELTIKAGHDQHWFVSFDNAETGKNVGAGIGETLAEAIEQIA